MILSQIRVVCSFGVLFFVLAAGAQSPPNPPSPLGSHERVDAPAKMARIRRQIRKTLRAEATSKTTEERYASLVRLCDWYAFIRSHHEFETFPLMQAEASKIRNRLLRSKRAFINQLQRAGIDRPENYSISIDSQIEQTLADPSTEAAPVGAGAGSGLDNGWELVELIMRTVDPDAWKVHGGKATIQYFAARRILVVSATTEVHEELEALLRALR